MAGTFPLPAPQLDRFLFKVRMTHIERDAELQVVATFRQRLHHRPSPRPLLARAALLGARRAIEEGVHFARPVQECLVDVARGVREDTRVALGLSLLHGRRFISSEDVQSLATHLFEHRIVLAPGVADPRPVIEDALRDPLERLARLTLQG